MAEKPEDGAKKKDDSAAKASEVCLDDKRSVEDAVMFGMHTLVSGKPQDIMQVWLAKLVLEGLLYVLLVMSPFIGVWDINQDFFVWRVVQWLVLRYPFQRYYGYEAYSIVMYLMFALVLLTLGGSVLVMVLLRLPNNKPSPWLKGCNKCLQVFSDFGVVVYFPVVLDYFASFWNCQYQATPIVHSYYTDRECFADEQLTNMIIAAIGMLLYIPMAFVLELASTNPNPVSRYVWTTNDPTTRMFTLFFKAALVVLLSVLQFVPKFQVLLLLVCVLFVFWLNCRQLPFLCDGVNYAMCADWAVVLLACCCYAANVYRDDATPAYRSLVTMCVAYAFAPTMLAAAALTAGFHRWRLRAVSKFVAPGVKNLPLRKVHKFEDAREVALLARAARKFDLDGGVLPDAADLGEFILKCALARMPDDVDVLLLECNFAVRVRNDLPSSRLAVSLAQKQNPSFVQRWVMYVTAQEAARLKEETDASMDMQAHLDYQQRYRRALLGHKDAMVQVRELWRLVTLPGITSWRIETAVSRMDFSIARADRIYRAMLEAYPKNAMLVKRFGQFSEDVHNEFVQAARLYHECAKMGGTSHGIQSMDFDFASQPGKHEWLLGLDINEDAVVIINMQGQIMMVSPGACAMWGYDKKELEGQNVSMLMPQPFNVRHNSYLQRYQDTGEARILDSVKEVVALHKDRTVFPVEICVTKLSGKGADAMFFGLVRHIPISKREIKAWVAPNGTVLCCGAMFSTLTGIPADQMVGVNVRNVVKDPSVIDAVLQRAAAAREEDFASRAIAVDMHMLNKYVDPIPCHMYLLPGGTQQTRLYVMHIVADKANDDNLLVVDEKGSIEFATVDLALSLGYTLNALMKLNLAQLLPHPVASMHAGYLMDAPPNGPETSCREGAIVHLVSASKALMPVSLKVTQREEPAGTKHVAVVSKADRSKHLDQRRVKLLVKLDGTVEGAEPTTGAVFGFSASQLVGRNLCDVLDVFKAWEDKTCARDMRLLLMTLLEREDAIPGCSWRAKLSHPDAKLGRPPKHVILQADVAEKDEPQTALLGGGGKPAPAAASPAPRASAGDDTEPRVHLLLWKTDALVGSMQMDAKLRVVYCDPLAGLILGQPSALLLRKPLHRLLSTGGCKTWESLMGVRPSSHKPRSRDGVTTVSKPSKARAFEARHPDGGSVRVVLQGVVVTDVADGKAHVHVTVHPDASHPQAARTDLLTALGLDDLERAERASKEGSQLSSSLSEDSADERPSGKPLSKGRLAGLAAGEGLAAKGEEGKKSGGAFVASWVRSMSELPPDEEARVSGRLKKPRAMFAVDGEQPDDWREMAQEMPDEAGMGSGDDDSKPKQKRGEARKNKRTKESKKRSDKDADDKSEASVSDGASSQGEDASAYSGSVMTSVCEETLVDQRRAKVLRKLRKLVHSQAIRQPLERVRVSTYWVLIFAVVMRIVAFIVLLLLSAEQKDYNQSSYYTAIAADVSQVLVEEVQTVVYCSNLPAAQRTNICAKLADPVAVSAMITKHVDEMEAAHYNTFLGHKPGARKLHDASTYAVWSNDSPTFESLFYMDTSPWSIQTIHYGLFQLGNSFIAAVREVQYQMTTLSTTDMFTRSYWFVALSGPTALFEAYQEALDHLMEATRLHIDGFNTALVVLLVVEGCVLLPLLAWWMWAAVAASENLRLLRWCCLSTLPAPVRLSLATRPAKVSDGDDDASDINDSSDNDNGEAAKLAQKSAAAAGDSVSPAGVQPTYTRHAMFVGPLLLWMAALVGVYAACLAAIAAMRPPVGMLNTAMRVLYRLSRLRMATLMAVSQHVDVLKGIWLGHLNSTAHDLEADYNTLMYGGRPTTLENAAFFDDVVASTFYSRTLADAFFETNQCLRYDLSTCYDEASEWYEVTHHGLDTMMRRVLDEAFLLLRDNNTVLTHENPRARAIYYIADRDLYEGMHTSAEIYVDDANANATFIVTLQLAMLVAVVLLAAAYVCLLMWPYLRLHDEEADKVAGILSHVPNEVDVVSHTKKQLRRGLPKAAAKKAAVAPAVPAST